MAKKKTQGKKVSRTKKTSTRKAASKKKVVKKSTRKASSKAPRKTASKKTVTKPVVKKSSSVKKMDQGIAILALVLNILILPGVGTLVAGDTKKGIWQLLLAIISIPLMIVLIGIPLYFGVWIWGIVTGIKYVQNSA